MACSSSMRFLARFEAVGAAGVILWGMTACSGAQRGETASDFNGEEEGVDASLSPLTMDAGPSEDSPGVSAAPPVPTSSLPSDTPRVGILWRRPADGFEWVLSSDTRVLVVHSEEGARVLDPSTGETPSGVIEQVESEERFAFRYRLYDHFAMRTSYDEPWLTVVDVDTRRVAWTLPRNFRDLPAHPERLTTAYSNGVLLLADGDHYAMETKRHISGKNGDGAWGDPTGPLSSIVALRAVDGTELWHKIARSRSVKSIHTVGDRAVMVLDDGIVCVSVQTGETFWAAKGTRFPWNAGVANGRIAYRESEGGVAVRAVDDGRLVSRISLPNQNLGRFEVLGDYLAVVQGTDRWWRCHVTVADLRTGAILWTKELESTYQAIYYAGGFDDRLVLFTGGYLLRTLDIRTGEEGIPWGFTYINNVVQVDRGADRYLIIRNAGYGSTGELIAVGADPWPEPREVTVSGCATVKVDRRLCKKAPIWVTLNQERIAADKNGCFEARLPARGILTVAVDEKPILEQCRSTQKMKRNGEFHCADNPPVKLHLEPKVDAYHADVSLEQIVCEDI